MDIWFRDMLIRLQYVQSVNEAGGSWYYTFEYKPVQDDYITVEKGSVSVNGVSLTVVNSKHDFI